MGRPKSTALPTGVTGGARTVGAVVGQMSKIPGLSFVLSVVVPKVQELRASPAWQLAKAQDKMRLAEAMRSGNVGGMQSALVKIEQYAPKSTSPNESPGATGSPLPVSP